MQNFWTQFSPAGIYYFGLDGFHRFFYNSDGISNGVILLDSQDVLSFGVLFHSIDSPFHRVQCAMSLKDANDPLIQRRV